MSMQSFILYPCCLFKTNEEGTLTGVIGALVDDAIAAGAPEFMQEEDEKSKKLRMNPKSIKELAFSGAHLRQGKNGIKLDQKLHASAIDKAKNITNGKDFGKRKNKLSWRAHSSRPDLAFYCGKLSQVKKYCAALEDIKLLRKAIGMLQSKEAQLQLPKLDLKALRIVARADASFAANWDETSQLGHAALFTDASKKRCMLRWNSHKSQRVTRSALGSEICAFCDGMGIGIAFRMALKPLLGKNPPLHMRADSKSLFDAITRRPQTQEMRLLIDLAAARESYRRREITDAALARSERSLADAMTNPAKENILSEALGACILERPVEQWVIRE